MYKRMSQNKLYLLNLFTDISKTKLLISINLTFHEELIFNIK